MAFREGRDALLLNDWAKSYIYSNVFNHTMKRMERFRNDIAKNENVQIAGQCAIKYIYN